MGPMFNLPPVLAHVVELVLFCGLTATATGTGLRILRALRVAEALSAGERLVFGMGLGYGVLALLMLGMGLVGLIYLPVGLGVLALLVALAAGPVAGELRRADPVLRLCHIVGQVRYPPTLFLTVVLAVTVGAALTRALVPVATQDDLMYHLALPRRYIEHHAVLFFPDSTYSLFPQLMEMLYTWGLLLGSDRLAVLFAFGAGLLGALAAGLFAARHLTPASGGQGEADRPGPWQVLPLLVVALFLTAPLTGYVLRAANTDLAQASFDLLAVYAFFLAMPAPDSGPRPNSRGLLALAGLCAGLAFSVKYYGFVVGVALGVALPMLYHRRRVGAGVLACVLSFGVPFVALAALWLVRNYVWAGNPVWPLAGGIFDGAYWSPAASPEELLGRAPGLRLDNVWTALQFLWTAISRPPLEIDGQIHVVSLGPLLLPALPGLLWVRWARALKPIAYAAGAYWLVWAFFFSRTSIRYLSTFFLLAAVLGAYALVWMTSRYRPVRWAVATVLAAGFTVLTVEAALSVRPYLPTVLATDRAAEQAYLATYMEDYQMIQYITSHTPANAVIYVWDGQPRGYYLPRRYVYARLVPLYTGFGSQPEQWHARLVQLGITHVLVHERQVLAPGQPAGVDPFAEPARRFRERYFGPLLYRSGDYYLYELR